MIKAVTAVNGDEVSVNAKAIQHSATEVNRFVRQNRQPTVHQMVERLTYTWIKSRSVQHVGSIIGKKHLQCSLNISFSGLIPKSAPDEHERAITDETSDFALRQNRQIELIPDVVDGRRQILFGIEQRSVEIKYEHRSHRLIIAFRREAQRRAVGGTPRLLRLRAIALALRAAASLDGNGR